MIELLVTKTAMTEYLRVIKMAFDICGKFTITNDIIDPSLDSDVSGTIGAHRIRHPKFSLLPGIVYGSVPNLDEIMSLIREKKGIKTIKIVNTEKVLSIQMDCDEYILATAIGDSTSNKTFDEIINQYMKQSCRFTREELNNARLGKVITMCDQEYGPVRISRSNFPFTGIVKVDSEPNFSGSYSFGCYDTELNENYIAMHVQYKACEAFHMYVFVPFEL